MSSFYSRQTIIQCRNEREIMVDWEPQSTTIPPVLHLFPNHSRVEGQSQVAVVYLQCMPYSLLEQSATSVFLSSFNSLRQLVFDWWGWIVRWSSRRFVFQVFKKRGAVPCKMSRLPTYTTKTYNLGNRWLVGYNFLWLLWPLTTSACIRVTPTRMSTVQPSKRAKLFIL